MPYLEPALDPCEPLTGLTPSERRHPAPPLLLARCCCCCCHIRIARGPRPRRQWQSLAGPARPWRWASSPAAAPGPASCGTPGRRLGGERKGELLAGSREEARPRARARPCHETKPRTSGADFHESPSLVPAGQGGAGGQLGGWGVAEAGSTHLPRDQRDVGNSFCCRHGRGQLNMRAGT